MDRTHWNVLVVEDDDDIRQLIGLLIRQQWKCRVVEAGDGLEAVVLATRETFDLILLDLVLPGLHGLRVMSAIKSDPLSARTPIVVVSDHCWKYWGKDLVTAGALTCVDKGKLFSSFEATMGQILSLLPEESDLVE
jgi:CheY-like chemotaxis protein